MTRLLFLLVLISSLVTGLGYPVGAQDDDAVLFTVDDLEVPVSEFRYIYEKNNRDGADYSEESIQEYLDLYTKFKLKVKLAMDMQLDTIEGLQRELDGYRQQLAKSFLMDKNVTEKLVREAYDRMTTDLRLSHILFKADPSNPLADDQRALKSAQNAYAMIQAGTDFAEVARDLSQDKSTSGNGGDLGWITAMLPKGFYAFETAAYNLKPGEVSEPVKSVLGYHILKLHETRPARGKVEVSHILSRINESGSNAETARQKIDMVYKQLQDGGDFERLARSLSDDTKTAKRGGYIGKIGINTYDPNFEEAAFAIEEEGSYSEPIRSRVGWHIIKLIKKLPVESFEDERRTIEARMTGSERSDIAREQLIARIKSESGYTVDDEVLENILSSLDVKFQAYNWDLPDLEEKALITFKDAKGKSNKDFVDYMKQQSRFRMRSTGNATPREAGEELFKQFSQEACIAYAESKLPEQYPAFAALIREYEEGILLFEVTKLNVWDKAGTDTTGLQEYFEAHREDYMWPERAEVVKYQIQTLDEDRVSSAREFAMEVNPEKWVRELNKDEKLTTFSREYLTKEEVERRGYKWEEGWTSEPENGETLTSFVKVQTLLPVTPKQLDEARGYVIADYQQYLEQQWIEALREKYDVEINEDVLESLIRK